MKRVLFFITLSMTLSFTSILYAQRTGVSARLNMAELKGNTLNLNMDVKISQMQIGRYESLSITFVLKGTGRGQTQTLPPVIVNGANKRNMFERAVALYGETAARNGAYTVLKNDPQLIQYVEYKRAVAYKSWMNSCQLILVGEIKDYHNNTIRRFTNVLEKQVAFRRPATTGSPNTINIPPATRQSTNRPSTPTTNRQPAAGSGTTTGRPAGTATNRTGNQTTNRPAGTTNRAGTPATNRPARTTTGQPAGTTTNRPATTTNRPATTTNRPTGTAGRPAAGNNNRR